MVGWWHDIGQWQVFGQRRWGRMDMGQDRLQLSEGCKRMWD